MDRIRTARSACIVSFSFGASDPTCGSLLSRSQPFLPFVCLSSRLVRFVFLVLLTQYQFTQLKLKRAIAIAAHARVAFAISPARAVPCKFVKGRREQLAIEVLMIAKKADNDEEPVEKF